MSNYSIQIELSEKQAHLVGVLSQKKNMDVVTLVKQAINEYIENNVTEDDSRLFFAHTQTRKKTIDDEDKAWRAHWNSMNDQQKKQFDDTFKKGLEIGKEDPDFEYTWTGYIHSGELPPLITHPDVEWHRLSLLWHSKLTKDTKEDLVFFGRTKDLKKSNHHKNENEDVEEGV